MTQPDEEAVFEALDPGGIPPDVTLASLARRPPDLKGKRICVVNSWPVGSGSQLDDILLAAADWLRMRFPEATVTAVPKPSAYQADDSEFWDELSRKADAIVYGAAPSCATTMYAIKYTGLLERRGIPGVAVIFDNLIEDARITCEEIGMAVRWATVPYPPEGLAESEGAKIMERIASALLAPLDAKETQTGVRTRRQAPAAPIRGTFAGINAHFYEKGLTDGLPIIPPDKKRVSEMLKGTAHAPDEIVTRSMWPAEWGVTVEKAAIVGVMAGCTPADMPVLLATIEAFSRCGSPVRSTNSFSYMRVVNGPIRKEIGMNGGTYALGPGNRANATIGRFLSLAITNLGGGQIGVNLMGTQGNVSGYAFCFPENEEESPWESFAAGKGFKTDESTLTMFTTGWSHCGNYLGGSVDDLARAMAQFTFPSGMAVLTSPARAKEWAKKGVGKADFADYIWSHATLPMKVFRQDSYYKKFIEPALRGKPYDDYSWPRHYLWLPDEAIVPVYPKESVQVVVVGADQNPMMQGWKTGKPTTVSIDRWR